MNTPNETEWARLTLNQDICQEIGFPQKGSCMNEEKIQRSQSDLLVFISSCQDSEMEPARNEAFRAIVEFPLTRPWAFEKMPASPQSAREHYLQNAADADFAIWLIGERTTQPVIDEIHTCVSVQGKLLAFKMPSRSRDKQTNKLIDDISDYAKWRTVECVDQLGVHIKAAISDEIVRSARDSATPPGHRTHLSESYALSIEQCKYSWTTLGVPDDIADQLSQDQSVGHRVVPPVQGIQMLIGDQGAGKTLAAQRIFQKAASDALDDSSKPFPVFVRARNLNGALKEHVESVTHGYAFPSVQGALVIIDGLDEVGKDRANRLLDDIEPYVKANPKLSAVITTRPLPGLKLIGQHVTLTELDENGTLSLISKVAGRTVELRELRSWHRSIQHAVTRPLFAVMIGSELRKHRFLSWANPAELIERVATRALDEAGPRQDEVDKLLQDLAVRALNSGESVDAWRVSSRRATQGLLIDSRLVAEEAGKLDFILPIFREWFAARALVEGAISLDEIQPNSVRWVIPIAIAINSENESLGRCIMTRLAYSDPGMASLVLEETERTGPPSIGGEALPTGTAHEVGSQIHQAMKDWGRGVGALTPVICPVTNDGRICTLGIFKGPRMITTSWYRGTEQMAPVVDIPTHFNPLKYNPDWSRTRLTAVRSTRTWPWFLTKEMLVASLSKELKSRKLALQSVDAVREFAHEFASAVTPRGFESQTQANIGDVVRYIDERTTTLASLGIGGFDFSSEDIRLIRRHLVQLSADGEEFISDPWPGPNLTGPWIGGRRRWYGDFSEQQLLERTKAVYGAALRIYKDIVDSWLGAFAKSLRLNSLLPVRLEGRLIIPRPSVERNEQPFLDWWPRPVGDREESQVAFELGDLDHINQHAILDMIESAKQECFNHGYGFWSSRSALHVSGFRPATELAHRWLVDEMRELNWAT